MSEARKFDQGKPMFTAMFTKALNAVMRVMTFGATKYGKYNYLKNGGLAPSRLVDAAYRHMSSWWDGEKVDSESGESHLAHAICCLGMLLEYELRGYKKDDRFKEEIKLSASAEEVVNQALNEWDKKWSYLFNDDEEAMQEVEFPTKSSTANYPYDQLIKK